MPISPTPAHSTELVTIFELTSKTLPKVVAFKLLKYFWFAIHNRNTFYISYNWNKYSVKFYSSCLSNAFWYFIPSYFIFLKTYHQDQPTRISWSTTTVAQSAFTWRKGKSLPPSSSMRSGLSVLGVDTWSPCRQEPTDNTVMLLSSLSKEHMRDTFCGREEIGRRRNNSNSHDFHGLHRWCGLKANYLFAQQSWQSIFIGRTKN